MSRADKEFREMLEAHVTCRTVVLSVLQQIGIHNYKDAELAKIVRQAAIDLTARKQVHRLALKPKVVHRKRVSNGKR
jgi:hypothetical protein